MKKSHFLTFIMASLNTLQYYVKHQINSYSFTGLYLGFHISHTCAKPAVIVQAHVL